eukprot:4057066-Prymnesium_polylepis.2
MLHCQHDRPHTPVWSCCRCWSRCWNTRRPLWRTKTVSTILAPPRAFLLSCCEDTSIHEDMRGTLSAMPAQKCRAGSMWHCKLCRSDPRQRKRFQLGTHRRLRRRLTGLCPQRSRTCGCNNGSASERTC